MIRRTARWLLVSLVSLVASSQQLPGADAELLFATPKFESLDTEFVVNGRSVNLTLAYDQKGKLVRGGDCTVNGVPVTVKGTVKTKNGLVSYKIVLKASVPKVAVKIAGALAAGATGAAVTYKGPEGKQKFPFGAVSFTAPAAVGRLSFEPIVDGRGKVTGTGQIVSNFGNDSGALGLLKGKRTEIDLRFSLKVGTQTIKFKGSKVGDDYIGPAKVKIPPEKGTIELKIEKFDGGDPGDTTPPTISVASPADNSETTASSATVRGTV